MTIHRSLALLAVAALLLLSACDSLPPAPPTPTNRPGAASGEAAQQVGGTPDSQDPQQIAAQFHDDLESLGDHYDKSLRETLGPANPSISNPEELQEAISAEKEAEGDFSKLRPTLDARDQAKSADMAALFTTIDGQLNNALTGQDVPASGTIEANADKIAALLDELLPAQ